MAMLFNWHPVSQILLNIPPPLNLWFQFSVLLILSSLFHHLTFSSSCSSRHIVVCCQWQFFLWCLVLVLFLQGTCFLILTLPLQWFQKNIRICQSVAGRKDLPLMALTKHHKQDKIHGMAMDEWDIWFFFSCLTWTGNHGLVCKLGRGLPWSVVWQTDLSDENVAVWKIYSWLSMVDYGHLLPKVAETRKAIASIFVFCKIKPLIYKFQGKKTGWSISTEGQWKCKMDFIFHGTTTATTWNVL